MLDEAQTVKNHQGKTYQAVRRLDVPFRLALTGTPMENRLMELWSLLSHRRARALPLPRSGSASWSPTRSRRRATPSVLDRFRRRIRPFLLRRTKDLVAADLPPKQEQVLEVELDPAAPHDLRHPPASASARRCSGCSSDFDQQPDRDLHAR